MFVWFYSFGHLPEPSPIDKDDVNRGSDSDNQVVTFEMGRLLLA